MVSISVRKVMVFFWEVTQIFWRVHNAARSPSFKDNKTDFANAWNVVCWRSAHDGSLVARCSKSGSSISPFFKSHVAWDTAKLAVSFHFRQVFLHVERSSKNRNRDCQIHELPGTSTQVRLCLYDVHRSLLCLTLDKHVVCWWHVGADLTNWVENLSGPREGIFPSCAKQSMQQRTAHFHVTKAKTSAVFQEVTQTSFSTRIYLEDERTEKRWKRRKKIKRSRENEDEREDEREEKREDRRNDFAEKCLKQQNPSNEFFHNYSMKPFSDELFVRILSCFQLFTWFEFEFSARGN